MKFILLAVILLIILIFFCNSSFCAQDIPKNPSKTYSKEQIAKQNILTLFRWIESGDLGNTELRNAITVIRKQLKILHKECALRKDLCAAVYGYLDNAFFATLIRGYEFMGNNRLLLNRLFVEASEKVEPNRNIPEVTVKHPWLDVKNNLLDCLENETVIYSGKSAEAVKTDLSKPEIFIAPSVDSVVSLVSESFESIFKTKINLSGAYRLVHKGSTARGTSLDNTDFDFDIVFDNQKDVDLVLGRVNLIVNLLTRKWKAEGYNILSKEERQVQTKRLINFIIQNRDGVVLMIQIFMGKDSQAYVDRLNAQIGQIKALGGSWDNLKGQIILFKKLVRGVLHSYRKSLGGLDGMECEQFIIQADSSLEYGRKITSIGSFDKTMRWIYKIGFDQASSTIIPLDKVSNQARIYHTGSKKDVQIVCTPAFWNKLVNAARKYVELNKIEMSEEEFASLGY